MSTVRLDEKKDLYRMIRGLSDDSFEKAVSYVEYLRYIEEQEDKEDIAYIEAHKDEPAVLLEEALEEIGL